MISDLLYDEYKEEAEAKKPEMDITEMIKAIYSFLMPKETEETEEEAEEESTDSEESQKDEEEDK